MRDYKKVMDMIIQHPESSNEFILNSAGAAPGMSVSEVKIENESLRAIRTLSPETIEGLKKLF